MSAADRHTGDWAPALWATPLSTYQWLHAATVNPLLERGLGRG